MILIGVHSPLVAHAPQLRSFNYVGGGVRAVCVCVCVCVCVRHRPVHHLIRIKKKPSSFFVQVQNLELIIAFFRDTNYLPIG